MPYGSWVNDLPIGFFLSAHKEMDGAVIVT
jgi:hypothetical protein